MSTCICGQSNFTENQYIVCNNCQRYIHLECANLLWYQAREIYIFYCQFCRPYTGPSIAKNITNSHRHDRNEDNSEMLPIQTGTPDYINYLKKNSTMNEPKQGEMKKMRGQQLTLKDLVISGFDHPILIETKDGLEIMTEPNFNFDSLMLFYDVDHEVEVSEVTRQIKVKLKLTNLLAQFAIYPEDRQDVFILKLDLSQNNKLANSFVPPRIVRKLSWVDQYWPNVPFKPLMSKYCFISMQNSFTDFHIDIGGASAWYHIMQGEQIFYFIEPTEQNLNQFQQWINTPARETMLFANSEKMFKTKVSAGETIFIPNGWIYAILSIQDSITFGGFFLHSLSISSQLHINDFLHKLNIPELDFPSYELTNWYAAPNILKLARESFKNQPPRHLSEGIEALTDKLRYWLNKSKSKRNEGSMIVPKAINCAKIIRDLNHCLRNTKKKPFGTPKEKEKSKSSSSSSVTSKVAKQEKTIQEPADPPLPTLDPEETRIKDLVKLNTGSTKDDSGSKLKLTFNMKLAQDVIRRSLDDPYDLNSEHNDKELLLIDSRSSKSKKKRKRKDEKEIAKMIQGRREDDNYIYLDIETPEENREAIKKSNDKMWEPGTSGKSSKPKVKKISSPIKQASGASTSSATSKQTSTPRPVEKVTSTEPSAGETDKSKSKPKKGLATPKQRLAKKLKMSM